MWIAIQPPLASFGRRHHRMCAGVCVLSRVAIGRAVAAQSRSAFLACAEMNRLPTDLHAFGALAHFRLDYRVHRIEMKTTAVTVTHFDGAGLIIAFFSELSTGQVIAASALWRML